MNENSLQTLNIMSEVFGLDDPHYFKHRKISRNPDVFTYDSSIDYKEDFGLIVDSFCDCGCKTAVYVKEGCGEDSYTEFKTQIEYEKLPNQPKPTSKQVKLQTDIISTEIKEQKLGIIHSYQSCIMIPVPKLEFNVLNNRGLK